MESAMPAIPDSQQPTAKPASRYDTVDDAPAPTRLSLPSEMAAEIEKAAETGYPHEVCGLLVGRLEEGVVRVERLVHARNLREDRANDRYLLDPQAFLDTDRAARRDGLEIVGVWHSHPDAPARPSVTDLESAWPGWSYVIVSIARGGAADLRSYRLEGERFREEEIERTEGSPP